MPKESFSHITTLFLCIGFAFKVQCPCQNQKGETMKKVRIAYFSLICNTIVLGLISRKISFLPLCIGDMLWGVMIFFILAFIRPNRPNHHIAAASLAVCYLVEFSQLYQAPWINAIRQTIPGRLVLGHGFLWSDLIAYTVGIATVWGILKILARKKRKFSA